MTTTAESPPFICERACLKDSILVVSRRDSDWLKRNSWYGGLILEELAKAEREKAHTHTQNTQSHIHNVHARARAHARTHTHL